MAGEIDRWMGEEVGRGFDCKYMGFLLGMIVVGGGEVDTITCT